MQDAHPFAERILAEPVCSQPTGRRGACSTRDAHIFVIEGPALGAPAAAPVCSWA